MSNATVAVKRRSKLPFILAGACVFSIACSFSMMAAAVYIH